MIGLWFTYGPDSECLIESIKSFRRVFPAAPVCICDDGKEPLSEQTIRHIAPSHYEQRTWDSKGNLNGWEAILGILDFQLAMSRQYPETVGALKIDCDTLLLSGEWIDQSAPICGLNTGNHRLFIGVARYLRHDAAKAIKHEIKNRWIWPESCPPEDITIGSYALLLYGSTCKSLPWIDIAKSYDFQNAENDYQGKSVVCFGNRSQIQAKRRCDKRAFAGMHMARMMKSLAAKYPARPPSCPR